MAKRGRKSQVAAKRQMRDEVTKVIQSATGYMTPPPRGVVLDTEEKQTLWGHYTSFKLPEHWPAKDLLKLYEIIVLDIAIAATIESATSPWGAVEEKSNGTLTVSADLQALKLKMDMRNTMLRLIGLNVIAQTKTLQTATIDATDRARRAEMVENDDDDLLAGFD